MALKIQRVDTWAAPLDDEPGRMATKLRALASAGVNLEMVVARRSPEKPGTGVVFVTPIKGAAAARVAHQAGFRKTVYLHTVRVEGPDKSGETHRLAQALAQEGLSLCGLSASAINRKFLAHIVLDSEADAAKAVRALRSL